MIITLIGMMGSGKSSAAREIAAELDWDWIDTDELIIERENREIESIFAEEGEKYFRRIEKQIISEIYQIPKDLVVATGGGAVIARENRRIFLARSEVFWLSASVEILLERTAGSDRPLLKVADKKEKLNNLLEERKKYYRIGRKIDTSDLNASEVADRIIRTVNLTRKDG